MDNMDLNFSTSSLSLWAATLISGYSNFYTRKKKKKKSKVACYVEEGKGDLLIGFRTSILRADGRVVSELPAPCTVLPKDTGRAGLQVF